MKVKIKKESTVFDDSVEPLVSETFNLVLINLKIASRLFVDTQTLSYEEYFQIWR